MRILLLILSLILFSCSQDKSDSLIPEPDEEIPSEEYPNEIQVPLGVNTSGDVIVGAPTDNTVLLSIAAPDGTRFEISYGVSVEAINTNRIAGRIDAGGVAEIKITELKPSTRYYYRLSLNDLDKNEIYSFVTRRRRGETFSFGIQGDSHPERSREMFDEGLYKVNMYNAAGYNPDFYFTIGDDFSIERFISNNTVTQKNIDKVYSAQRSLLGMVGCNSAIFLVNGNHEQAAKYLLDGTAVNPAVCAGLARKKYYPLPDPEGMYRGNTIPVEHIGFLKDYYAFEWGDALFVTLDPYWHSEQAVDNIAGSSDKVTDPWNSTLGEEQYRWFKTTLESSVARYKFVFSHHVRGTGRGGIEEARLYEWGGSDNKGRWLFDVKRPGWEMPVHQLMVKHGVTIFFQGHDHLFCRQELDGVVYQSLPNPADNTYRAFNQDAYKSGDILPNSGHLNVTVGPDGVSVKYIRAYLSGDGQNGEVAYSYNIE